METGMRFVAAGGGGASGDGGHMVQTSGYKDKWVLGCCVQRDGCG